MSLIVQKFGGTSVANPERIRHVATLVERERALGNEVIVVLSAMSGVTDQLVTYAREMSDLMTNEARADYDFIVSTGEQITCGLLALYLRQHGTPARAWAGWQVPLISEAVHGSSRIQSIDPKAVRASLDKGEVAVIAGFQGRTEEGRITTLGRGGSDTSAVAIAAAFGAARCDIYTDVDGVYTCDPRIVTKAKRIDKIAYEEMLELASLGAKVLQTRSVEMAVNHRVRVRVLSTFTDGGGTELVEEEEIVEKQRVTGLAYSRDEARITLVNVENKPGVSASLFGPLADAGVNVDMIVQNVTEKGEKTDMTFTVSRSEVERAVALLHSNKDLPKYESLHTDKSVVKLSVVGTGMRSHAGVAAEMFRTLAEKQINIIVITTSEIKISVLIAEEYLELALRALHTAYGLDAAEEKLQ